jgi:hypothetical protein
MSEGPFPSLEDAIEFRRGRLACSLLVLAALAGCTVSRGPATSDESGSATSSSTSSGFTPDQDNKDPSKDIDGVVITEYEGLHAEPGQRVAYTKAPPDGGRHAPVWADCSGAVYQVAVANEYMVHALEHGSVWIAYEPGQVTGADREKLAGLVDGVPYMMMSPYPGLDAPVSLQSWGHQLKVTDVADERIGQFIEALRVNQYTSPEPGGRCDSQDTGFDVTDPPPFDPTPPGPGAAPVGK